MTGTPTENENAVEHYVDPTPFNPATTEALTPEQERYYQASQWKIMWWKFKRHKIAVWSGVVLILFYLCVPFAEVIAPYTPNTRDSLHLYAPPQPLHLFHEGKFVGPFVYGMKSEIDMTAMKWVFTPDPTQVQPVRFFCRGDNYKFWGLFTADFHLFCPAKGGTLFLAGTDRLGRDQLSGLIYGARLSLTVGLVGVTISIVLGLFFGGIAGFFGVPVSFMELGKGSENHKINDKVFVQGNSLYTVVDGISWKQAEENGGKIGGNLAAIGSQEENDFINEASGYIEKWIGFTDEDEEGIPGLGFAAAVVSIGLIARFRRR